MRRDRRAPAGLVFERADAGYQWSMIVAGLLLMLVGLLLGIPILWTIGIIVAIVGLVLLILGRSGRRVGGRAHYW